MGLHYFHFGGDDYVAEFDSCLECGRTPCAMQNIPDKETGREQLFWICPCGGQQKIYQHNDDCPCTLGGECEFEGVFDESPFEELEEGVS